MKWQAATRKLATKVLHFTVGRASEAGWLRLENINWDPHYDCAFFDVEQTKVCKLKKVTRACRTKF